MGHFSMGFNLQRYTGFNYHSNVLCPSLHILAVLDDRSINDAQASQVTIQRSILTPGRDSIVNISS